MPATFRSILLSATALSVSALIAVPAVAQDTEGEEIVVTGSRQSLKEALAVKKQSTLVIEAISADDLGQLPSVTIADSLVRLPGVNGTRDRGNESQAVVRGLGARLVLGTVNGREVASSEPDRNVRWEVYPTEVVNGVQVYKSQSAELLSGGVAATINISTIHPLEYSGPTAYGSVGPVYYTSGSEIPDYDPWGYRGGVTFVKHVNDKFAFVIGGSYQQQKNGYPSVQGWGYNDSLLRSGDATGDLNSDGTPDPTPWGAQTEVKKLDQDRAGLMLGVGLKPNDNFTLNLDALYSDVSIDEKQDQTWFSNNGTWGNWANGSSGCYNGAGSSYTIVNRSVVAATLANCFASVTNAIAHYTEDKDLYIFGANAEWAGDMWSITSDLSYSSASRENTWAAVFSEVYPASTSFDFRSGIKPFISVSSNTADPTIQVANSYRPGTHDGPEKLDDEVTALALDFVREFSTEGLTAVRLGARGADRTKGHSRVRWNQPTIGGVDVPLPAGSLFSYQLEDISVPPILSGDFDALVLAAYGGFDPSLGFNDPLQRWEVNERVYEAYLMGDIKFGDVIGNIGVRVVNVETTSDGFQSLGGGAPAAASEGNDYTEVLPSLNLNWWFAEDKVLRLGAARVLSRPPLDELRLSRSLEDPITGTPPLTGSDGNPLLEPFKATQFDASFEWYFHDESLFALAGYYKDVDSHIGYFSHPAVINVGGTDYNYDIGGPANGEGGGITGVELTFQTPFYFLEGLEDFGIYANYAHVDTDLKEFVPAVNPLPSAGFAENTATIDLWFNNGPVELRVGYRYHSPFTVIYGWDGSDLRTIESESVYDASASYQITANLGAKLQINNLTDEPLRIYRDNNPDRLGRYDEYGRRISLEFSFKY